jgi:glucose/arabinose dehydrogenase
MLLVVAACSGGGDAKRDAALPRDTGGATADAPPLIACTPRNGTTVSVRQIGRVSGAAMLATSPPNDGRLFVLEQVGRVRIFENEQLRSEPFLDISNMIAAGGEQGLLGLAFHPDYANNRQFFVYYTTSNANVVARYFVSETDYNKADAAGEVVLSIPDFASNHNGGMIEFGADGYLYIGTGDGGGGGDPCRVALQVDRNATSCQNPPSGCNAPRCEPLLGKILRIDVNTTTGARNYGIPSDNPYASGGGEPEIFIRGLRNPWRWSFDRATGDMYIGDVGQNTDEELTILTPAEQNGANLGWSDYEGTRAFRNGVSPSGVKMPQLTRNQTTDGWKSIIAGQVYRGSCFPDLVGDFFFNDHYVPALVRGRFAAGNFTAQVLPAPQGGWPQAPASIHADARGELFITTTGGHVYQIEAGP